MTVAATKPKRTYDQFCPAARALDVIGERWTLLVVRELLWGPRRYGEIARGLPGVAPNMLSQRLRELQEHGLIERCRLDDEAPGYQLTELGAGLAPVMRELFKWGAHFLDKPRPGERLGLQWILNWITASLNPHAPGDATGVCEFRIGEEALHVIVGPDHAEAFAGPAAMPDAVVTLDLETYTSVGTGELSVAEAEKRSHVIGDLDLARRAPLVLSLSARAT